MIGQLERIIELKKLQEKGYDYNENKIFSFSSGKGGTGKTVLSLNIAYALSKMNKKILFIDLDSNFSNANIMLNLAADKTIGNFFSGSKSFNEVIEKYEPNLHFIFGDSGKTDYSISTHNINNLFSEVRKISNEYDFILIDNASGVVKETLEALLNSDFNIIITTPEPTAVMDAYVVIKILKSHNYKKEILVLLNKCINEDEGKNAFNNLDSAVNHFLNKKTKHIGSLSDDPLVRESIIDQQLLLINYPSSTVSFQLKSLASGLIKIKHYAQNELANIKQ